MDNEELLGILMQKLDDIHASVKGLANGCNMIDGDYILDFNEVCSMLKMSERQVRRFREIGKLKGFLFGKRRMYRYSEVQAFIRQSEKDNNSKTE